MCVHGGGIQILVTKQHLNDAKVRAIFKVMRSETVAERMGINVLFDARIPRGLFAGLVDYRFRNVSSRYPSGKEVIIGSSRPPILTKHDQQSLRERNIPVFSTFS